MLTDPALHDSPAAEGWGRPFPRLPNRLHWLRHPVPRPLTEAERRAAVALADVLVKGLREGG